MFRVIFSPRMYSPDFRVHKRLSLALEPLVCYNR